ncbi:KinB-signaling pathway activation protein [Pontibacillus halophilus JSM 076056 = DSM 19796]|uniref:KinB-signaling pathway activation protein n=1 Tax=Pontibacillus halophilus JSM 076056 = DSM 19796 TaxID=1385510 RepID=A0A0A5GB08_9BACI|nr:KinB-signaling pathway activation protein [Pontibacillus halophilus]KGX90351.1 KinB-signaling pathway activation protein [Pontibacillus halophilus JSM 076056 = DSM 19796]
MTSQKWVRLFIRTLALGAISTLLVSFFVKSGTYVEEAFQPFDALELIGLLIWFSGLGFIFSVISQMGFFAYLTINQFGKSLFRSTWKSVQVIIILFTLFDLVYFRYRAGDDGSIWSYMIMPVALLLYALAVAYVKKQETNGQAFIPAVLFMFTITTVEWVPALRADDGDWLWLMLIPLLVCNTYQLIRLHRINQEVKEEQSHKEYV